MALECADREFGLLLLCARTCLEESISRQIEQRLKAGIDWAHFLQLATDHHVLPLVRHTLRQAPQDRIPPEVIGDLQGRCNDILRSNLFLLSKLLQVTELLQASGITAIPYKGPVIAALAYGNAGLRQFSDIDILVSREHYQEARNVLLANGYWPGREGSGECALLHERDGSHIDLHQSIMPGRIPFEPDFAAYRERLTPIEVAGREIESLSPEDTLIVLCAQLVKDASGRPPLYLIKICDIAELVRANPELDWKRVVREARALGCARIVASALLLARQLLQAPIPELGLASPRRQHREALLDHTLDKLVNQWSSDHVGRLGSKRIHFMLRERWRDKLLPYANRFRKAVRPNERDQDFLRLPRWLWPVYTLLRPIRLLRDRYRPSRQSASVDTVSDPDRQKTGDCTGPDSSNR